MRLRCDAGTEMGAGHFFRCLSLAEHARAHGVDARLCMASPPDGLRAQAAASGVPVDALDVEPGTLADADATAAVARADAALLIDGYHFPTVYYRRLSQRLGERARVAALVDVPLHPFPVDVLINVNLGADPADYDAPGARLLFGVEYALLRRQFLEVRRRLDDAPRAVAGRVGRVLVMLGGGDPTNETTKVLRALGEAGYAAEVDVVIGPTNPHGEAIEAAAAALDAEVRIHRNVTAMAELMAGQDLAVCAGGGVAWELSCLGLPFLSILVADNQREGSAAIAARGISRLLGWHTELDAPQIARAFDELDRGPDARLAMREAGMALVDGRGALRVLEALGLG